MISEQIQNLVQPIIERAAHAPDQTVLIFYNETGAPETVTASEFYQEALTFSHALRRMGIQPDELVIVVLKHSRLLLSAFWGSLLHGSIGSIFPYLTEKLDPQIYKERIKILVSHSGAKAIITFPEFKSELESILQDTDCKVIGSDEVQLNAANPADAVQPDWKAIHPDKTAFLQHSSGTTGLQKGVMLSHRAVLNQVRAYGKAIALSDQDKIVSWLPLYHDMGLIAGFVMPIVTGVPLILMSPFQWVRDPKILFQAIDHHQGTLVWLPNFAYNHSVRSIRTRDSEGNRLNSLRAVINCSEPVRNETHNIFLERFGQNGMTAEKLQTCYAMAENTFAVTQSVLGKPPKVDWVEIRALQVDLRAIPMEPDSPGSMAVVSNGPAVEGTEIAIADAQMNHLAERQVGEIILRSNCMLSGYHQRPDASQESIHDGWYYTGDIGYIADGELYISGRKKDLIIVGGKNVFPQDLEAIANITPGIYPGRASAFGVNDERLGSEAIVMVCELENENASDAEKHIIERDLRQRVARETEVTLADVRLVDSKWVIKTSSGKMARSANRDKYLQEFH